MRTVRVRIAVALDRRGWWSAIGWKRGKDRAMVKAARETSFITKTAEYIHFIEADVPLPESVTVQGVVTQPVPSEGEKEQR